MEHSAATIQNNSASLSGRTVVELPDDGCMYRKVGGNITEVGPVRIKSEFDTFYYRELYCSYDDVITAVESWGKVEAILTSGVNHLFIVSFKNPIKFSQKGFRIGQHTYNKIENTPFKLRGIYDKHGATLYNFILSENMIAFDIECLKVGLFNSSALIESQVLLPHEGLRQIRQKVNNTLTIFMDAKEEFDSMFSETDKAKRLLEWIKQSGLSILEKGIDISRCGKSIGQYSVDEIVANYITKGSSWKIIKQAEK